MNTVKTMLLCGLAVVVLPGCDRIGSPLDAIGGNRPAPDEFRVVTHKPLNMPGSTALPEPRLGERSPLEHDPNSDARLALTGNAGTAAGAGSSAGENALVTAAAASAARGETGTALSAAEADLTSNKPYEPPTIMELLNLEGERAEDVLDPNAESRRLSGEGVAPTPVNPNDAPPAEAGEEDTASSDEKPEGLFPYRNPRKRN